MYILYFVKNINLVIFLSCEDVNIYVIVKEKKGLCACFRRSEAEENSIETNISNTCLYFIIVPQMVSLATQMVLVRKNNV